MKIVATQSAQHLIDKIALPTIDYTIKQFSDGELYLKLNQDVKNETLWVIAGTQAPAENMLELFFLLDALTRAGTKSINIFFTYFAYARQTRTMQGEAMSAGVICNILKQYTINKTYILHAHAADDLHKLLNFTNVIDFDFFCNTAQDVDIIAAPDKGAVALAQKVGQKCNKEVIYLEKKRPEHEQVIIEMVNGNISDKKVLIVDDMISTGRTLIHAAHALKNAEAMQVSAAATHGLCSAQTYQELTNVFEQVSVTNSILQKNIPNIDVWDIGSFIDQIMKKQ